MKHPSPKRPLLLKLLRLIYHLTWRLSDWNARAIRWADYGNDPVFDDAFYDEEDD